MRRRQVIAAVACLVAGAIGFAGVYSTERAQENREDQGQVAESTQELEDTEELNQASTILEPKPKEEDTKQEPTVQEEPEAPAAEEEATPTVVEETLHFTAEELSWPLEGNVLLNYSVDSTIYFPTLEQYQYNPAIVIQGNVNDKVYLVAKGKITDISTNEVTGCTVTEDLGDGYTAVYGQLKELNFAVGDLVEAGQVIGYVSEPTKYYSVEGSNLYFQLQKDGVPVNPFDFLE